MKQLQRLSPSNPVDHLRLLCWILVTPQRLNAYRDRFDVTDERRVGRWLSSTLIWLPLVIPTLALGLGILPRDAEAFPIGFYLGCLLALGLAWTLTGWLGNVDIADGMVDIAPLGTTGVAVLGLMLAVIFCVAVGVPIGIADALSKHTAFAVMVCVCIAEGVAFVVANVVAKGADAGILGSLESFVALGVASFAGISVTESAVDIIVNLIVFGVAFRAMLDGEESVEAGIKIGRPFWIARAGLMVLVLVYAFLFWFSFLGGWRRLA
ncbi:MAG: hypothetical protein GY832_38505 [Chloroflexi bacterium]|nr:hypothetical protein [Chloroflexota bacterium]